MRSTAREILTVELDADLFSGDPLGALGQFRENRRVGAVFSRSW